MQTRRRFISNAALLSAGSTLGMSARSYAQIAGSNERMHFAVIGLNGRAGAHLASLHASKDVARITHVCDVDSVILDRFAAHTEKRMGEPAAKVKDFRKLLESKDVDAITIATPEHWHTPMAIAGLQASKHVYVEKPCSHNPHECEMLVAAQAKYPKFKVQMGNQQRSSAHTKEIVGKIHNGLIGRTYYALAWYRAARLSMGVGKVVPVPATLDWDLWQGPAPRAAYKDNVHPYNWHWLKRYGTGEALNNGTHEVDVARWALDVKWPETIRSTGGRFAFKDDWEFPDTQQVEFKYGDKQLTWNSTSCNNAPLNGRDRGAQIFGTTGSVIVDRDGYDVFDIKGKQTDTYRIPKKGRTSSADTIGADDMTDVHFRNLINAVRTGEKLDSPIEDASVSVAILLMSNIAYELKRDLKLNTQTGAFIGDPVATRMRSRTYQAGWAPKV